MPGVWECYSSDPRREKKSKREPARAFPHLGASFHLKVPIRNWESLVIWQRLPVLSTQALLQSTLPGKGWKRQHPIEITEPKGIFPVLPSSGCLQQSRKKSPKAGSAIEDFLALSSERALKLYFQKIQQSFFLHGQHTSCRKYCILVESTGHSSCLPVWGHSMWAL